MSREASCAVCRRRKVRCDRNRPCSNCTKAGVTCHFLVPSASRSRIRDAVDRDLIERIRQYERIFAQNDIDIETVREDLWLDHSRRRDNRVGNVGNIDQPAQNGPDPAFWKPEDGYETTIAKTTFRNEFHAQEDLLNNTSEDEETISLRHAFNRMFRNDGFDVVFGTQSMPITEAHPSPAQIFRLWQVYIDNVNCLIKLHHVPTFQAQLLQAASELKNVSKQMEAAMFGIYLMAVNSMAEGEVMDMFALNKQQLLLHFHAALQQALANAGFLHQPELLTLQAYVMDLVATRTYMDPRRVFSLFAIAVRNAQQMALYQEDRGLEPFEVEYRRRLWWLIVCYDRRLAEMTGSSSTTISSAGVTAVPLNIDDSNLFMPSSSAPKLQEHPAEMTFALTRIALARAYITGSNHQQVTPAPGKAAGLGSSRSYNPVVRLLGGASQEFSLDEFCMHMENTYLAKCDAEVPVHHFTQVMTRQALCKMRFTNFLTRIKTLDLAQKDEMFQRAIEMLELDNTVQSVDSLRPFRWYAADHLPVAANMFLARELRQRNTGTIVDRAWRAVSMNHDLRKMQKNRDSPMYAAYISHLRKAWASYEESHGHTANFVTSPSIMDAIQHGKEERRIDDSSVGPASDVPGAKLVETPCPSGAVSTSQIGWIDGSQDQFATYGSLIPEGDAMSWTNLLPSQPGLSRFGLFDDVGFEDADLYDLAKMAQYHSNDV